jgi:central kinetochore subunit Mal2/MCM21
VEDLKDQLRKQATTFYSARFALIQKQQPKSRGRRVSKQVSEEVRARIEAQQAHDQQCLYRLGASVTTFKVRDPDPNAVDNGVVLGLRFEVMTSAKYLHPYFVFLNRPWSSAKKFLRVHRHTVPPCIPLSGLAARYLLPPKKRRDDVVDDERDSPKQDLVQFVRTLRREMVRYHNRIGAMADIRRAAGLARPVEGEKVMQTSIVDVRAVDPQAKQTRLEWSDGRSGRIVVDDDGKVAKLVVFGPRGRDRETARELFSEGMHIEDVAEKVRSLAEAEATAESEAPQVDQEASGDLEESELSVAS